uniref:ShKT domain-containing protein n=1 Tax=Meloidogyne floridensis TaxID=298350 RepID=A0A915NYD2_9BILA
MFWICFDFVRNKPSTTTTPPPTFAPEQQQQRPQFQPFRVCHDSSPSACLRWLPFCATSAWMQQFCKASCRLC